MVPPLKGIVHGINVPAADKHLSPFASSIVDVKAAEKFVS